MDFSSEVTDNAFWGDCFVASAGRDGDVDNTTADWQICFASVVGRLSKDSQDGIFGAGFGDMEGFFALGKFAGSLWVNDCDGNGGSGDDGSGSGEDKKGNKGLAGLWTN